MVRGVFGAMGSRSAGRGPGGSVSVREEIVTRADGRRVVRTTTTTTTPGGTTTRVEGTVVGAGGKYDYYARRRRGRDARVRVREAGRKCLRSVPFRCADTATPGFEARRERGKSARCRLRAGDDAGPPRPSRRRHRARLPGAVRAHLRAPGFERGVPGAGEDPLQAMTERDGERESA